MPLFDRDSKLRKMKSARHAGFIVLVDELNRPVMVVFSNGWVKRDVKSWWTDERMQRSSVA